MNSVGFLTPVTFGPFVNSFPKTLVQAADAYFYLGGDKVLIIPGYEQGKSEGGRATLERESQFNTALKAASYIAASISALILYQGKVTKKIVPTILVAIPLLAAVARVVLRSIYKFHLIDSQRIPFVGESAASLGVPPTDLYNLEANKMYCMTYEEMAKLQITPDVIQRGHNLPQKSNATYTVPPGINTGRSALNKYKDSTFEFDCKAGFIDKTGAIIAPYYEVVRREGLPVSLEDLGSKDLFLTMEQIISLKILVTEPNNNSSVVGRSVRKEYQKFSFGIVFKENSSKHQVVIPPNPTFPVLSFNRAETLRDVNVINLKLMSTASKNEEAFFESEPGVKWTVHYSEWPEYENSVILKRQLSDSSYTLVRMLLPKKMK